MIGITGEIMISTLLSAYMPLTERSLARSRSRVSVPCFSILCAGIMVVNIVRTDGGITTTVPVGTRRPAAALVHPSLLRGRGREVNMGSVGNEVVSAM